MKIRLYHVDAFASRPFRGNPAAVCPLPRWLPDATLQAIAAENHLSETAFFVKRRKLYELRWFAPLAEVRLCGHATLATAYVLFHRLGERSREIRFRTKSGILTAVRKGPSVRLDFPARKTGSTVRASLLKEALGIQPRAAYRSDVLMAVLGSPNEVRRLKPDLEAIKRLDRPCVVVTAKGRDCDFVSRFFAPRFGIPEDPATGSSHCLLAPYWARILGKKRLKARQLSSRGGEIHCEDRGARVLLEGRAVLYSEGVILL